MNFIVAVIVAKVMTTENFKANGSRYTVPVAALKRDSGLVVSIDEASLPLSWGSPDLPPK